MATPNLELPELSPAQGQKEVTWNWALRLFDKAVAETLACNFTSGNVTLTAQQFRRAKTFVAQNVNTTGRTLTVPAAKHWFFVDASAAANDFDIVCGSTTHTIMAGAGGIYYTDGTADGLLSFEDTAGTPPEDFLELFDVGGSYTGNAGRAPAVNDAESGIQVAQSLPAVGASPGAWRLLHIQDLAASPDVEVLGDSTIKELMLVVIDLAPSVTDGNVFIRFKVGGSYQNGAGSYGYANHAVSTAGGEATLGNTGTALDLTRFATGGRLINAGDPTSGLCGILRVFRPHDTCYHRTLWRCVFQGTANHQQSEGGGVWGGGTGAIQGIRFGHSSGAVGRGTVLVFGLAASEPLTPFDPWSYTPGLPGSSQIVMRQVFAQDVDFPADLTASQASAEIAADAQADFDIQKNGVSIGTMTFDAAADTATFDMASAESFAPGDVLTVVAPASQDATLAGVSITLAGTVNAG